MLISWIRLTKFEAVFCILKIVSYWFLSIKSPFEICILVLWIHKSYFVVKKLMWNVRIKALWYTNIIIIYNYFIQMHIPIYVNKLFTLYIIMYNFFFYFSLFNYYYFCWIANVISFQGNIIIDKMVIHACI